MPVTKYGKDYFKRSCESCVIVVNKSCCPILVLAVIMTVQRSFSAVTNAVATINDCWPAVILSAVIDTDNTLKEVFQFQHFLYRNFYKTMSAMKVWNLTAISQHVFIEQLKPTRRYYYSKPEISIYHWSECNVYVQWGKRYIGV